MRRAFSSLVVVAIMTGIATFLQAQAVERIAPVFQPMPVIPEPIPIYTLHFDNTPSLPPSYVVTPSLGPPIRTNDAHVMLRHAAAQQALPTQRIYFDTSSLEAHRREAVRSSLRIANQTQRRPVPLHFIGEGVEPLASNDASREQFTLSHSGRTRAGPYHERAKVRIDGHLFTLTVMSRARAAVRAFLGSMKRYFTGAGQPRTNTIAIVNHVRRQVARSLHKSEGSIVVRFKDQLSRTHFVELRQPRDIVVQ